VFRERLQALRQAVLQSDVLVQLGDMQGNDFPRRHPRSVEQLSHLVQRNSHQAQRLDLLQPLDIRLLVQSMAGRRAERGREQPDLVVVVERAYRHSSPSRELSHLPGR